MSKTLQILLLIVLSSYTVLGQRSESQLNYIERYKDIAVREMERTGVPASIKLAQGLLESNAGQSTLARRANNHFGMKCGSNWQGDTFFKEDDDYDANGQLIKSCFRSYRNGQASFIAHSEFLRDPRKAFRYGFLFRLDPKDYRRWAYGLKQAGYATSPTYPEKLLSLIDRYELYRYDNETAIDITAPAEVLATGILNNNDVKYVVVSEGETLDDIARRADISVRSLIDYNENLSRSSSPNKGERLYVQPKRNSYRGRELYHTVAEGETMFTISQRYGIRLEKLYQRNRLDTGQEPRIGERIKLRGGKV
ncbi:MAG: glucosaminidase domain-containing protein, partial [Bacteroidota bacterium]